MAQHSVPQIPIISPPVPNMTSIEHEMTDRLLFPRKDHPFSVIFGVGKKRQNLPMVTPDGVPQTVYPTPRSYITITMTRAIPVSDSLREASSKMNTLEPEYFTNHVLPPCMPAFPSEIVQPQQGHVNHCNPSLPPYTRTLRGVPRATQPTPSPGHNEPTKLSSTHPVRHDDLELGLLLVRHRLGLGDLHRLGLLLARLLHLRLRLRLRCTFPISVSPSLRR